MSVDPKQEPGAGNLHAGICAGGAPKGVFLPRQPRSGGLIWAVVLTQAFVNASEKTSAARSIRCFAAQFAPSAPVRGNPRFARRFGPRVTW